ncbi:MAG: hypothetical protein ACPHCN_13415 [Mycobacterium sp.]
MTDDDHLDLVETLKRLPVASKVENLIWLMLVACGLARAESRGGFTTNRPGQ